MLRKNKCFLSGTFLTVFSSAFVQAQRVSADDSLEAEFSFFLLKNLVPALMKKSFKKEGDGENRSKIVFLSSLLRVIAVFEEYKDLLYSRDKYEAFVLQLSKVMPQYEFVLNILENRFSKAYDSLVLNELKRAKENNKGDVWSYIKGNLPEAVRDMYKEQEEICKSLFNGIVNKALLILENRVEHSEYESEGVSVFLSYLRNQRKLLSFIKNIYEKFSVDELLKAYEKMIYTFEIDDLVKETLRPTEIGMRFLAKLDVQLDVHLRQKWVDELKKEKEKIENNEMRSVSGAPYDDRRGKGIGLSLFNVDEKKILGKLISAAPRYKQEDAISGAPSNYRREEETGVFGFVNFDEKKILGKLIDSVPNYKHEDTMPEGIVSSKG